MHELTSGGPQAAPDPASAARALGAVQRRLTRIDGVLGEMAAVVAASGDGVACWSGAAADRYALARQDVMAELTTAVAHAEEVRADLLREVSELRVLASGIGSAS